MVCLGNMCMATLHKGDNDVIIIIIIIKPLIKFKEIPIHTVSRYFPHKIKVYSIKK